MNFKKLLTVLLILSLAPMGAFADTYSFTGDTGASEDAVALTSATMAPNLAEFKSLPLSHKVSRKSSFGVAQQTQLIQEAGATNIAVLSVINNTSDGYSVFIEAENGHLKPEGSLDGEANIPYALAITHTGLVGIGMTAVEEVSEGALDSGAVHGLLVGSDQQSPTDAEFSVDLDINVTRKAQMSMAGIYNDTLTFIYEDL
jgi:hypothetical protein